MNALGEAPMSAGALAAVLAALARSPCSASARFAALDERTALGRSGTPLVFGVWVLCFWQVGVTVLRRAARAAAGAER